MMKHPIYADYAATTNMLPEVLEAMQPYFHEEFANPSSLYNLSMGPRKAVKRARAKIASYIGAEPEEIFFTSGGSESDNWALKGYAFRNPKEHISIITSAIEHHAILRCCEFLKEFGHSVTYLPVNRKGEVSPQNLEKIITEGSFVSVMMANNEIGTIEPIKELAEITHNHKGVFHTDAVQAVGHISIDVEELGIDMLSASAHKFNGPRGIGFLYKRNGIQLRSLIHGGSQEFGMRAGTENVAGIVGMAKALEINCQNMQKTQHHLLGLKQVFQSKMAEAGIEYLINESENCLPGTISISLRGMDGERLLHRLDLSGIEISTGSACNSKETELSHG